jgi:hypothetical protein
MDDHSKALSLILYSVFIAFFTLWSLRRGAVVKRYGGSYTRDDNPRLFWFWISFGFATALLTLGYAIWILVSKPH